MIGVQRKYTTIKYPLIAISVLLIVCVVSLVLGEKPTYAQGAVPPAALEDYPNLDPRLIGAPIMKSDTTASLVLYSQAVTKLNDLKVEKDTLGLRLGILEPEIERAKTISKLASEEYEQLSAASRALIIQQYSQASNRAPSGFSDDSDSMRRKHQSVKLTKPLQEWLDKAQDRKELTEKYVEEVEEALQGSKDRLLTIDADIASAEKTVVEMRGVVRNGMAAAAIVGLDIPVLTMDAYLRAERTMAIEKPECGITWWMLAGVGRAESNHGRYGGRALDATGTAQPAIIGVQLNGNGFAAIKDTDDGFYDGDTEWDRAVGVMQFIPGTWKRWGSDGDGDGATNPQNVYDGALAAARYLCSSSTMTTQEGRMKAFFSYNRSTSYGNFVSTRGKEYAIQAASMPELAALVPVVPVV